jgi:spoIIIJ-associated protein
MEASVTDTTRTDREDLVEKASDILVGILQRMGIAADIDISDDEDRTTLAIQTADSEVVIGRRGVVLDALQHLVNKAIFKDRGERGTERGKPIVVDAGGFRDKQVDRLRGIAQKVGEKALATQQIQKLQPMSPHDRRIVHMAVAEIPGLSTRSEGEGEDRHILIVPTEGQQAAAAGGR